jgi:hypothetical protein
MQLEVPVATHRSDRADSVRRVTAGAGHPTGVMNTAPLNAINPDPERSRLGGAGPLLAYDAGRRIRYRSPDFATETGMENLDGLSTHAECPGWFPLCLALPPRVRPISRLTREL